MGVVFVSEMFVKLHQEKMTNIFTEIIHATYTFGEHKITPKDVILVVVSSFTSAITGIILVYSIQYGLSIYSIILIVFAILTFMPLQFF